MVALDALHQLIMHLEGAWHTQAETVATFCKLLKIIGFQACWGEIRPRFVLKHTGAHATQKGPLGQAEVCGCGGRAAGR